MKNSSDLLLLTFCLLLYLGLAAAQIDLPGLYYDEAADARPAVQWLGGGPVDVLRGAGLPAGGRQLPLMVFDYVGPWNTYLLLPLLAVFGSSTAVLRGLTIGAGALTLLLSYGFARDYAGRAAASGTALFLAVSPAFVLWTREGIHVTSILLVFSVASLWLLFRWRQDGHPASLIGASFCLGAGLTAKFLFLWWILALAAVYALLIWLPGLTAHRRSVPGSGSGQPHAGPVNDQTGANRPAFTGANGTGIMVASEVFTGEASVPRPGGGAGLAVLAPPLTAVRTVPAVGEVKRRTATDWWVWPAAALAFLIGTGPLVLFNVQSQGTIEVLRQNAGTTHLGANNLNLPANFALVADHTLAAIQGGVFWYLGGIFENRLWPPLFLLATAGWIALLALRPDLRRHWRRIAVLYVLLGLLLVQSAFTVSSLEPTHHLIVWPLPQLLVAWGAVEAARTIWQRARRPAAWAAVLPLGLAGMLFAGDLLTTVQYHQALARSGGLADHSDAIYHLADWLEARGAAEPVALDWGFRNSIVVRTGGAVDPVEIFMYDREPPPQFYDWLYGSLTKTPDRLYLLHADSFTVFPRRAAFEELAGRLGREVRLEQQFRQRDGTVVFEVYSARPG